MPRGELPRSLITGLRSLRLFLRDPLVHVAFQNVQGQSPGAEHYIMELFEIELRAEFLASPGPNLLELYLALLISQAPPRPADEAIDPVTPAHFGFAALT